MPARDYGRQYDRFYGALVTPFHDGTDRVDEGGLRRLASQFCEQTDAGTPLGIVVNPEAGEVFCLSREEARRSVAVVVDEVDGRVPVCAGAAHATTLGAAEMAADAIGAGATGLFVLPPIGSLDVTFGLDAVRHPDVWLGWLRALLAAAGDVPLIVHPLTGRHDAVYGDALPLEAVLHICTNIPQVVGWKMTYPYSAVRALAARLGTLDHHVGVFPANGSYFHEYLLSGYVDGAVTGCFNYALDVMLAHIRAWRHDDLAGARGIWDGGLYNLQQYIFSDSSRLHVRFKAAAWLRGYIDSPLMRPPMPAPEVEEVATLRSLLVQMGVDVRQDGQMAVPAGTLHL